MNVNEGSIPYKKAVLAESLEEERRLFLCGDDKSEEKAGYQLCKRKNGKDLLPSRLYPNYSSMSDSSNS